MLNILESNVNYSTFYRYRSCYEKMPEHGTSKSTVISHNSSAPMSARLSRAMRRLVVSEGEEKMR